MPDTSSTADLNKMPSNKIKVGLCVLLALAISAAVYVCVVIYRVDRAERTLQAIYFVTSIIGQYVDQTGKWPESWQDLTQVKPQQDGAMYRWPQDVDLLKEFVYVDFDISLSDVASSNPYSFTGVRPINSTYTMYQEPIRDLVKGCQRAEKGGKVMEPEWGIRTF